MALAKLVTDKNLASLPLPPNPAADSQTIITKHINTGTPCHKHIVYGCTTGGQHPLQHPAISSPHGRDHTCAVWWTIHKLHIL